MHSKTNPFNSNIWVVFCMNQNILVSHPACTFSQISVKMQIVSSVTNLTDISHEELLRIFFLQHLYSPSKYLDTTLSGVAHSCSWAFSRYLDTCTLFLFTVIRVKLEMFVDLMYFFFPESVSIYYAAELLCAEINDSYSCFTQVLPLLCSCWPRNLK